MATIEEIEAEIRSIRKEIEICELSARAYDDAAATLRQCIAELEEDLRIAREEDAHGND